MISNKKKERGGEGRTLSVVTLLVNGQGHSVGGVIVVVVVGVGMSNM